MARKFVLGPNAARKFSELIRGSGEVSRRAGAVSGLAFESEYAAPYTVQWAQSAGSGSGSWIIWLPSSELVVTPDGSLNPAQSLTAAGGEYPAGWYLLHDSMLSSSSGGTLYLNITLGDDPGAEFSNTPSSSSSGSGSEGDEDKFSIPICNATVTSDGERKIKQFATSVITVGGSGDGGSVTPDDVSTEFIPHDSAQGADNSDEGKLQIKGFKKGTPTSSTTIAADLQATGTNGGHVLFRESDGSLKFKEIGKLTGQTIDLSDFAAGVYFATGIEWTGSPDYQIKAPRVLVKFANNKLSVTTVSAQTINTTPWTSAGTTTPT